jgi:hypothetical protein
MPEQLLDGPNVIAVFQQMSRERVPEGVARRALRDAGPPHRFPYGPLDRRLMEVMPLELPRDGIAVNPRRGKHELPLPVFGCAGRLARERTG